MSAFDRKFMIRLRRLADRTGETVEEHINRAIIQFVKHCEAEGELPTKVIPFPALTREHEVSPRKCRRRVEIQSIQEIRSMPPLRTSGKAARSGASICCEQLTPSA
jgi:hypothetical protein